KDPREAIFWCWMRQNLIASCRSFASAIFSQDDISEERTTLHRKNRRSRSGGGRAAAPDGGLSSLTPLGARPQKVDVLRSRKKMKTTGKFRDSSYTVVALMSPL